MEGKHTLKPHGRQSPSSSSSTELPSTPSTPSDQPPTVFFRFFAPLPAPLRAKLYLACIAFSRAGDDTFKRYSLTYRHVSGVTITQAWTTASLLDSKVELVDVAAPGVKIDLQNLWNPSKGSSAAQKMVFAYKNPNVHARSFINYAQATGNIDAVLDVTAGHDGFLLGGEAGYDLQKAAVTKYSIGLGYQTPSYVATLTGTQNLSIIAASYYQKVNTSTEVSAKVGYDVNAAKASGLELASKYKLDPLSFAKAKVNDRGIAALAYNTKLNAGTTLGLGLSLDLNKLNEAGHKIGTHLTFEG